MMLKVEGDDQEKEEVNDDMRMVIFTFEFMVAHFSCCFW